jgi:hypothetical protein
MENLILNTLLFADDGVIVPSTEDEVQKVVCVLNNTAIDYNLRISVNKTKTMAMKGKMNVQTKVIIITQLNK